MSIPVTTTPYGPPAHLALAAAIDHHKQHDPLQPVAVIVPSNHVGIAARRALGRRSGIAAVTFLTPYRLAELLGAPGVAASGRRPVSTPVLAGSVRAVLRSDPGQFAGVEQHPTTERSLVRSHRALSEVSEADLRRLEATTPRTSDVVRIHRAVRHRLEESFSDEQHLVDAAIHALDADAPVLTELGPAILFLPQRLTSNQARLLSGFARRNPLSVLAGITGVDEADAAVRKAIEGVGAQWPLPDAAAPPLPVAHRALTVSDADDEVRHAVRTIIDAARRGTPLTRCAILYSATDPYARLVGDALDSAGINWFGSSVRTAEASLLGRSLLGLLALPDHDLSRHDVAAWLAGAPVRGLDNRPASVAAWERASRAAGIVAGLQQWTNRLQRRIEDLEAEAVRFRDDDEHQWRVARLRRDAEQAGELAAFITQLDHDLDPGGRATSWSGLASWCRQLVRTYLGGETLRTNWPAEERAAAQRIDAAIDRLADLDGIDPNPGPSSFRRALELQLADDLGRHGSFGNGVLVGNVKLAVGLELDTVVVLGMAEGSFPARRRDDPLLPDRVRTIASDDLPLAADVVHDEHRALLAVMAAASEIVFSFPRGDLRRNAERAPSRWLLDSTEIRDGVRPSAADLNRLTGDWLTEVPSFIAGLRSSPFPAHDQEYDVRALLDRAEAGADIRTDPLVDHRPALRRGIDLIEGRLSTRFTRFDGNLATDGDLRGARLPSPTDADQVSSATRLESWAKCPHAYFIRHILRVDPVEDPEEQYRISPLVLGSLVHDVLDRWVGEALKSGRSPAPGAPWPDPDIQRLLAAGTDAADRLEARGLVGRRVYWQRDRQVLMSDLVDFTNFDHAQRAAHGSRPLATEMPFGMPDHNTPPVTLTLADGRTLLLRGAIDRVDETSNAELVVIDYKTGSSRIYRGLSAQDPIPGGAHLQLVLYSLAVREILGRPDASIRGDYWFITRKGGFQPFGYEVTPEVEATALATVAMIVDGIASGHFPQHPAVPKFRPWVDCQFCEPDGLGLAHQYADWTRLHDDPELAAYLAVNGGDRG